MESTEHKYRGKDDNFQAQQKNEINKNLSLNINLKKIILDFIPAQHKFLLILLFKWNEKILSSLDSLFLEYNPQLFSYQKTYEIIDKKRRKFIPIGPFILNNDDEDHTRNNLAEDFCIRFVSPEFIFKAFDKKKNKLFIDTNTSKILYEISQKLIRTAYSTNKLSNDATSTQNSSSHIELKCDITVKNDIDCECNIESKINERNEFISLYHFSQECHIDTSPVLEDNMGLNVLLNNYNAANKALIKLKYIPILASSSLFGQSLCNIAKNNSDLYQYLNFAENVYWSSYPSCQQKEEFIILKLHPCISFISSIVVEFFKACKIFNCKYLRFSFGLTKESFYFTTDKIPIAIEQGRARVKFNTIFLANYIKVEFFGKNYTQYGYDEENYYVCLSNLILEGFSGKKIFGKVKPYKLSEILKEDNSATFQDKQRYILNYNSDEECAESNNQYFYEDKNDLANNQMLRLGEELSQFIFYKFYNFEELRRIDYITYIENLIFLNVKLFKQTNIYDTKLAEFDLYLGQSELVKEENEIKEILNFLHLNHKFLKIYPYKERFLEFCNQNSTLFKALLTNKNSCNYDHTNLEIGQQAIFSVFKNHRKVKSDFIDIEDLL